MTKMKQTLPALRVDSAPPLAHPISAVAILVLTLTTV